MELAESTIVRTIVVLAFRRAFLRSSAEPCQTLSCEYYVRVCFLAQTEVALNMPHLAFSCSGRTPIPFVNDALSSSFEQEERSVRNGSSASSPWYFVTSTRLTNFTPSFGTPIDDAIGRKKSQYYLCPFVQVWSVSRTYVHRSTWSRHVYNAKLHLIGSCSRAIIHFRQCPGYVIYEAVAPFREVTVAEWTGILHLATRVFRGPPIIS